eukprot:TRINITY_DN95999_c0_g1_i1.p2 TRINITY_DN95999_c0_g1~~TRINITY_DN95999_c0_g1_i1.p2  ORF type:complete len:164 (+),score=39.91 TRINITY_DN95999_c0_g1_i1:29-493(+)
MRFDVFFKAELENVTDVILPQTEDWHFVVEFDGDDREVYFSPSEKHEIPGSRGEACLVLHSKETKRHATVEVTQLFSAYTEEDSGKWKCIASFECRNCSLKAFRPARGWRCVATGSEVPYEDIDMSDDWSEYDSKSEASLSIMHAEGKVEQHRK